ncbi:UNVERIFIED_CONTAM: hypothetical protein GTU68_041696 [Idotea baltica]|nr:hypothetical protein [Idotea baltica]
MTQEEVHLYLKSISEIPTNISIIPNISLQLREHIPDSLSIVEEKLKSLSETLSRSIESLKVQLSATLNHLLEIRVHIPDVQELTPPLLDTPKMDPEPESDSHQAQERLFQDTAELQSVSSQEEVEMKSLL